MIPNLLISLLFIFSYWGCASASILSVRIADSSLNKTRIVIETSQKFDITSKLSGQDIVFFLKDFSPHFKTMSHAKNYLKSEKIPGEKGYAISFKHPFHTKKAFWISPGTKYPFYRYVLDIEFNSAPLTKKLPSKKRIVIDAGHGGKDPGTIGNKKVYEKNVTLKAAKLLAQKLKETGRYTPVLIRSDDRSMLIANRIRKTKKLKGDLFISLHADSCSDKNVRGLSLYTLSTVASDRQAARLAAKENKADLIMGVNLMSEIPEVSNILIDLTKREKKNLSSKFAKHLIEKLRSRIFLLQKPHRFANFYILKVPGLPSVLIELGYLSHPKESGLLSQKTHLKNICGGIIEAIDTYFKQDAREESA